MSGYVTLALGSVLGLLVTPILVRELGHAGFGTWALVLALMGYLGLLEMGLGLATITRVAKLESGGPGELGRLLSSSLLLSLVGCLLGLLATIPLAYYFPLVISAPPELVTETRVAVVFTGVWQCVSFVVNVYSACLLGTGRMYVVTLRGFAISATVTVMQALAVIWGGGLRELALLMVAGGFVTLATYRRRVRAVLPGVAIDPRAADRGSSRHLVRLGWRNSITSVTGVLAFGSDILLIGLLVGPVAAASYAIALRGYSLMKALSSGLASAMGPAHAYAAQNASLSERYTLFCQSVTLSLVVALPCGIAVGAFASPLLQLWIGDVPDGAPIVLLVLCCVLILQTPGFSAYMVLLNIEHSSELIRVVFLAAMTNVVASVFLTTSVGITGPALGSAVAVLIFDMFYLPRRICRMYEQTYVDLIKRVYVPLILPTLGCLFVVILVKATNLARGPGVVAAVVFAVLVFIAAWWMSSSAAEVRHYVRRSRSIN